MADDLDPVSRRRALLGLTGASLATLLACAPTTTADDDDDDSAAGDDDDDDDSMGDDDDDDTGVDCALTPEQTEGPFFFDAGLMRADITEGLDGEPVQIALRILDADTCDPIPDAVVHLWHADHLGRYSGYPNQGDDADDTSGQTWLRGVQISDAKGRVSFQSVYPGYYRGRAVHLHIKIIVGGNTLVTSQVYFPNALNDQVLATGVYAPRGLPDTTNEADFIFAGLPDAEVVLMRQKGDAPISMTANVGVLLS